MPMEYRPQPQARPEDHVDPSEYWQDEPGKVDGYANIYAPRELVYDMEPDKWGYSRRTLLPTVEQWLNDVAGTRRAYGLDWYLNTQDYDWYVRGEMTHSGRSVVQICIRDFRAATMFKLAWGGL